MHPGIIYAIIAALAFGVWTVFHDLASKGIDPLFGAITVSLTAVILGSAIILPKIRSTTLYTDPHSIVFALSAGVAALAIDYFALKAYSSGLAVSTAGPIIIAGSILVASAIGIIFLGEKLTAMKAVSIFLITLGSALLSSGV